MKPSGTETCLTCETCGAMPPGPNETSCIVQVKESLDLELMSSDEEQNWDKRSIYRVRSCIVDLNGKAYHPLLVSFGPYHHNEAHLLPMEEHKRRACRHFLKRYGKSFNDFLESLRNVAKDLELSYDALDPKSKVGSGDGNGCQFLKMMIIDGCFMLEILRTAKQEVTLEEDDYAANDPIFSSHGKLHIMQYIRRDMLMLENQLPMLLLVRLVAWCKKAGKKMDPTWDPSDRCETNRQFHYQNLSDEEYVNSLILNFYFPELPDKAIGKCLHVLDAYRKSLLLHGENPKNVQQRTEIIRSATELYEHGIQFKRSPTSSLRDISFTNGVLRLPKITVDDTTEAIYLNLIAFEHFHVEAGNEVTSYVFLMDKIIDSEKDVALLHAKGIIQNAIGSDEAVAKLFNSLCKEVTLQPMSSLDAVHMEVSDYCKKPWNMWRANLLHTYFRSPWSILSVIAAIFLFGITIIQTVYTVLYH